MLPAGVAFLLAGGLASAQEDLYLAAIVIGCIEIAIVAYRDIRRGNWSLDYIALLAMIVAVVSHEWLARAGIAPLYTRGGATPA